MLHPAVPSSICWGFSFYKELKDIVMCIPWGGTRTLLQGCSAVSWLFLPCLCIPSLPWLATVWTCPLGLREGQGGWTERLLCPGSPQGPARFHCLLKQQNWGSFKLHEGAWAAENSAQNWGKGWQCPNFSWLKSWGSEKVNIIIPPST